MNKVQLRQEINYLETVLGRAIFREGYTQAEQLLIISEVIRYLSKEIACLSFDFYEERQIKMIERR